MLIQGWLWRLEVHIKLSQAWILLRPPPLNLPMTILSCVLMWPSSVHVPLRVSMFRFPLLTRTPVTLD